MSGAPIGVTVSTTPSGQIVLAANGTKSQILVFSTSGTLQRPSPPRASAPSIEPATPQPTPSGDIYVANYESNDILEFSSSGACLRSWGTHGTKKTGGVCNGNGDGTFANPYGVAVGTDPYIKSGGPGEAIYVADSNDDCLQEFTPSGTWVAQVGSPGANTVAGTFTQLRRVAVDASGNVWGADLWGNRVEEFTRSPSGYTYSSVIPNPVVPPGDTSTSVYNQVRGISFDSAGDVVDHGHRKPARGGHEPLRDPARDVRPARLHQHRRLQLATRRGGRPGHRRLLDRRHQAERHADPRAR